MILLVALLGALGAASDTARAAPGVSYRIEARLDEGTDVLRGRALLRYTNRSGHALDTLWLHQHLNAFRPSSAFARREAQSGQLRFQSLDGDEHAFERFGRVEVDGRRVRPVYPGAPDSTVVALPLPAPLRPGATVAVRMDWDARLATVPRRQGRRGREFNWAHWYPRIAVFQRGAWQTQPLLPQGEFYGEFAAYDVTLDLPADQVVGATGVPVEGEPGWRGAAAPGVEIRYRRDAYPARPAEPLGLLDGAAAPGRRRVRWRAEDVHHFAWTSSPNYRYEGTLWKGLPVHLLYTPDRAEWGGGVVLERTTRALAWTDSLFGPYRWPQFTVVPRIESPGATEFPMLIMNASSSQGQVVHEVAHQYAHGMLANNEWREGWLDEGMASFVTNWFWESQGDLRPWRENMDTLETREWAGLTEPVALPGAAFESPRMYSQMTYTKAALVLRMLREMVGPDTMRAILREYFRRHALQHVTEADLRRAVRDVTGESYDWFFHQWLHTTARLDYAVAGARAERTADGGWLTRVEVTRAGEAWMPVTLRVGSETRTLRSRDRAQVVTVATRERPREVVLDPERILIDADRGNNRAEP